MFGFGKHKMGFGVEQDKFSDPFWDDYAGEGIWTPCDDCGTLYEIQQSPAFRELVEDQCRLVGNSSQMTYEEFRVGEPNGRWNVNADQARFTFTNADGTKCHARYGVMGSYIAKRHSWMWAWDFPSDWMPRPATEVARKLYQLGLDRDWEVLTKRVIVLNEHEAWHMANLGAWIAGYPMTYRAKVNDNNHHYYAIDRPVWLT